jgi:UDP-GlcNAc:undecaprenyl-phosphate GlcNAc-1-phosphate transferase
MSWPFVYIALFISAFLLSFLLTPLMIPLAFAFRVVDEPGERKIHKKVMPRLGGLAIISAFLLPLLFGAILIFLTDAGVIGKENLPHLACVHLPGILSVLPRLLFFVMGGAAIFIIGLFDDLKNISPAKKIILEAIVIATVVVTGLRFSIFPNLSFVASILTIIWILAITNAFNLLDNLDGLSSGVALIASGIFLYIAISDHQYFVATLLVIFAGTISGFLPYNFYPARIFMGDGGSLFIGYIMAGVTVLSTFYHEGQPTFLSVLMPVLILAVPLYDTASVILIRFREGRNLFKGDKSHFSHRLLASGMSERSACLFIYLVTFSLGVNATLLRRVDIFGGIIIFISALSVLSVIAILEFSARRANQLK